MKTSAFLIILVFILDSACSHLQNYETTKNLKATTLTLYKHFNKSSDNYLYDSLFDPKEDFIARDFVSPLGAPDGKGYFISKMFREEYSIANHLGEDWSGNGGGDTDYGDTIYAIAGGYVDFSEDLQFVWGGVVGIVHKIINKPSILSDSSIVHDTCRLEKKQYMYVKSFYAHCSKMYVKKGQWVNKGQPIAAMGNSGGRFQSHLHLEIRPGANDEIYDGGYSNSPVGFINPEKFRIAYNQNN